MHQQEVHQVFFPAKTNLHLNPLVRNREPFKVNFVRTEAHKKSNISHCQRLLNEYFGEMKVEGEREGEGAREGE